MYITYSELIAHRLYAYISYISVCSVYLLMSLPNRFFFSFGRQTCNFRELNHEPEPARYWIALMIRQIRVNKKWKSPMKTVSRLVDGRD